MKSVAITTELRKSLLDLYHESGKNQDELCKILGISRSTWCKWVNESDFSSTFIKPKTWKQIYPFIKQYLPVGFAASFAVPESQIVEKKTIYDPLTTDLLTQWGKLDRRDKLRVLAFIEQLNEEKNQSVYSSGA